MNAIDRLLNKIAVQGDCWEFCGARNSDGYGNIRFEGKIVSAHRMSYVLLVEPIPDNMNVLHSCDNRACINPEHLFLGTQDDNVQDMINKGRSNFRAHAVLSVEQTDEVKALLLEGHERLSIALRYDVSYMTIYQIELSLGRTVAK